MKTVLVVVFVFVFSVKTDFKMVIVQGTGKTRGRLGWQQQCAERQRLRFGPRRDGAFLSERGLAALALAS